MSHFSDNREYEQKVGRKTCRGPLYFEPWHPSYLSHGRSRNRNGDAYKNIDRTTIRKMSHGEDAEPGPVRTPIR